MRAQRHVPCCAGAADIFGLNSKEFFAQSFTVERSGTLTGLELLLFQHIAGGASTAQLNIWMFPAVGTQPSNDLGAALATSVVFLYQLPFADTRTGFGPFTAVLLSNTIEVTAGQRLAIAVRPVQSSLFWWAHRADNPYPGGEVHSQGNCDPAMGSECGWFTVRPEEWDMGFRTFVAAAPAPVPEPATVLLVGTGVLAAWRGRRVRGRARPSPEPRVL